MKICDKCREENYKNLISPFQVYGECSMCGESKNCNEHPEWVLIKPEDVKTDDIKNYTLRVV